MYALDEKRKSVEKLKMERKNHCSMAMLNLLLIALYPRSTHGGGAIINDRLMVSPLELEQNRSRTNTPSFGTENNKKKQLTDTIVTWA